MNLLMLLLLQEDARPIEVPNPMGAHTWFIILAVGAFLAWATSYSLQLQKEALERIASGPGEKRAYGEDNKPRVGAHRIGHFYRSCIFLQEQHEQVHQCFSLAPQSAQNLFVIGFLELQEGQTAS